MTRLYLVRHGQTAWNREQRFRGRAGMVGRYGPRQRDRFIRRRANREVVQATVAADLDS